MDNIVLRNLFWALKIMNNTSSMMEPLAMLKCIPPLGTTSLTLPVFTYDKTNTLYQWKVDVFSLHVNYSTA